LRIEDKKIVVTGGAGFLGSRVIDALLRNGSSIEDISVPRSKTQDLRIWDNCVTAIKDRDIVIHLAATEGGIRFNKEHPGIIFYDNAIMGINLMEAARREGVAKFVTVGTACSYPKDTPIPFKEDYLWQGYPEESEAAYGLSKKMLVAQGYAYHQEFAFDSIHLILTNLYGPGDSFDPEHSHVVASLIRKIHLAKQNGSSEVVLWGTGNASRELLHVDEAARAILLATQHYSKPDPVNIGSQHEIRIADLASIVSDLLEYEGKIVWDPTKPDGQTRRCLDCSLAKRELGFSSEIPLREGLKRTIDWYVHSTKDRQSKSDSFERYYA
jgi:GDP-L-fucose synthase